MASLSCYDEVMFEDDTQNAMIDSVDLFEEICNLRWFIQTAMILFLNKKDLFATKIQKVPISVCFDEYDGMDKLMIVMYFIFTHIRICIFSLIYWKPDTCGGNGSVQHSYDDDYPPIPIIIDKIT